MGAASSIMKLKSSSILRTSRWICSVGATAAMRPLIVLNLVGDVLDTLWSVRYVGLLHTASFTGRP